MTPRILAFAGSLRRESFNKKLTKSTESCPLGHRRDAGDATQGHRPAAGLIRGSSASRPNRAQ